MKCLYCHSEFEVDLNNIKHTKIVDVINQQESYVVDVYCPNCFKINIIEIEKQNVKS